MQLDGNAVAAGDYVQMSMSSAQADLLLQAF